MTVRDLTGDEAQQRVLARVGRGAARQRGLALKLLTLAVLAAWPLLYRDDYTLSWMTTAGLYLMLVVCVQLIIAQAGQLSFGHAAFYGIGAYTAALLSIKAHWPTLLALLAAPVVTGVVALIVGRPVLKLKYFYLALATIGLASICSVIVVQATVTGGELGLAPVPTLDIFGFQVGTYLRQYYVVWIVAMVILLLTQRALRLRLGRSLRAIATSEVAASTLGMRTANWKLAAFVAGAVYCGFAGALFAFVFSAVSPGQFAFSAALIPVIMMLVGGADTLWGGLVGAVLMTYVSNRLSSAQQYSGLIYSLILIGLLLFLPMGLAGLVRRDRRQRLWALVARRRRGDAVATAVAADAGELVEQRETDVAIPLCADEDAHELAAAARMEGDVLLEDLRGRESTKGGTLLQVDGVSVEFGGLKAVNEVSLTVTEGEIAALIGPNGAGKTTLFNVISRLQKASAGRVAFLGTDITKTSPAAAARLGMARTFQNLRIFENMNVLENVLVGCHRHERSGLLSDALGLPGQRREERRSLSRAMSALRIVGLQDHVAQPAASLPYGQQRLVEIARALASEPRLLLLDEPAAGMNAEEREYLVQRIRRIRDAGVTVLLVEHDIELVMGISDFVTVLDYGRMIASGKPEEVQNDPAVIQAYLGTGHEGIRRECALPVLPGAGSPEPLSLLSVDGVTTSYGSIVALREVSLDVRRGEIVAVLGANGAGKTTLLHTISGVLRPSRGSISFDGAVISKRAPHRITAGGVCHVPEGRQLFPSLSVEDNLLLGASGRRDRSGSDDDVAYVYELFPLLGERRKQPAGTLSGGEQQMVAIGRALTGRPTSCCSTNRPWAWRRALWSASSRRWRS